MYKLDMVWFFFFHYKMAHYQLHPYKLHTTVCKTFLTNLLIRVILTNIMLFSGLFNISKWIIKGTAHCIWKLLQVATQGLCENIKINTQAFYFYPFWIYFNITLQAIFKPLKVFLCFLVLGSSTSNISLLFL